MSHLPIQVRIFGGYHRCPGSMRCFQELARSFEPPKLIAVEFSRVLFSAFAAQVPSAAAKLKARWDFLSAHEATEIASSLIWEAQAPARIWPGVEILFLEEAHQAADLKARHGLSPVEFAATASAATVRQFNAAGQATMAEFHSEPIGDGRRPDPKSAAELIDRLWQKSWQPEIDSRADLHRDQRWADELVPRISKLASGWVAVVVGWDHANPATEFRLASLLTGAGFDVIPHRLGPPNS